MRRVLFLALLFVGVAVKGWCAVGAPQDTRGNQLNTIDWIGATPCTYDAATPVGITICASSRTVVYGVIASSVTATTYLTIKDATGTATSLLASTSAVVFGAGTGSNSSGGSTTQFYKFPVPIKCTRGLSIQINTTSPSGFWTVLYRLAGSTD